MGGGCPPPPPRNPPKSSSDPTHPNPPPRSESFPWSRSTRVTTGRPPGPTTTTARPTKDVSAPPKPTNPPKDRHRPPPPPPPTKTDTPKGAEKKEDRPVDQIAGTVVHVPYPTGVERGSVRGTQGRKYGAVWVEYPGGTTLYEVARPLLFPTPEEAERYRVEARAGKKKP